MNAYIEKDKRYLIQCYTTDDLLYTRGEGMYLYDEQGKPYLDFSAQFSSCSLGHRNQEMIDALKDQMEKLVNVTSCFATLFHRFCGPGGRPEAYQSGDASAAAVLDPALDLTAQILYNLLWVYNPTRLVVDSCERAYSALIAGAEQPVRTLCGVIQEYIKANRFPVVEAVSIGAPSSVARDKETVICTTNIRDRQGRPVFDHANIAADLRSRLGVPVFVNNDVNNILLYDVAANHLEGQQMVVGIYIGTGVGASVLTGGRLLEGKDGAELDLGHVPFFRGEALCSCGKRGCCECYASGWRLQEIRRIHYPDTEIQDLFSRHGGEPPLRQFVEDCAYIYAIMATIFNPDSLIAGGGVMEIKDFPRSDFERLVNEKTGTDVMSYGFRYVYSKPYVGKGVIGAAIFARRRMAELAKTA